MLPFSRMELESELRRAIQNLKLYSHDMDLGGRTTISLGSGCDLFMKYVTRSFTLEDTVRLTLTVSFSL